MLVNSKNIQPAALHSLIVVIGPLKIGQLWLVPNKSTLMSYVAFDRDYVAREAI